MVPKPMIRATLWLAACVVVVAGPSAALGQFDAPGSGGPQDIVKVTARIEPGAGAQADQLAITTTIKPGWHIYSITQAEGGPFATTIAVDKAEGAQVGGTFAPTPAPEKGKDAAYENLTIETHHVTVTWRSPLTVDKGVDPKSVRIKGTVMAESCDASHCNPPSKFPFNALWDPYHVAPGATLAPPTTRHIEKFVVANDSQDQSLLWAILYGLAGGLILNVMPCVLPVIGLKIMSFVEQAAHDRWHALKLNLWYTCGVMSVFLLLAVLALTIQLGWGEQNTQQWFNITSAAVVFSLGLSFLGVWEIPIPGFVGRGPAVEWAQKEGVAGAIAKGVLGTILAIPCGAPFLGSALNWTTRHPGVASTVAVFASAGLGMASPYLALGAFPGLLRFLPKPGAWMETLRQIMGFMLLATVVFIFTSISAVNLVPTLALLFGLWAGFWWIARIPLTAERGRRLVGWAQAAALLAVVWMIAFPGLPWQSPTWLSFGGIREIMRESVMRETIEHGKNPAADTPINATSPSPPGSTLPWQPFSRQRFDDLMASKKTVLVYFTASWCVSCHAFEKAVLDTEGTRKAVDEHRVVTLKADWTHGDAEVSELLQQLGGKMVPVLAIFPGTDYVHPIVFRDGYTQQQVLQALEKAGASSR